MENCVWWSSDYKRRGTLVVKRVWGWARLEESYGLVGPLHSKAPAVRDAPIPTHYLYFHSATVYRESLEMFFVYCCCLPTSSHWCFLFPTYLHSSLRIPEYRTWATMIFHHLQVPLTENPFAVSDMAWKLALMVFWCFLYAGTS